VIAAVFDTNALASGFTTQGGTPDRLLRLWLQGRFDLVVSTDIITELERTFQRPYFRRRIPATRRQRILALLQRRAQLTSRFLAHGEGVGYAQPMPVAFLYCVPRWIALGVVFLVG
jgi:hypothetical protein